MVINLSDIVPIVTIIGAAAAPTIAAIWAGKRASSDAEKAATAAVLVADKVSEVKHTLVETGTRTDVKLDNIHILVNNQLTQAVERLAVATQEIENLKKIVNSITKRVEDDE